MATACRRCGQVKPRTIEYWKPSPRCVDGLRKTCRSCRRGIRTTADAKYRNNNQEKRALLWARYYADNRERVLEAKRRYAQTEGGRARIKEADRRRQERRRARRNEEQKHAM